MDDDKKKPAGAGDRARGPKKPFTGRDGDKKPFQRQDGAKRAYGKGGGGAPRKPRPGKWERREEAAASGGETRSSRPYGERSDGHRGDKPRGDRPFRANDGEKRPYTPRDGDGPRKPRPQGERGDRPRFEKRDGDRPFRAHDGEKRPYTPRDGDGPRKPRPQGERGDRPRFEKRDGDRPFRAHDGEKRPYTPRDGDGPRKPRPQGERGDRLRFEKRDGDRPFRGRDGESRSSAGRGGDRPRPFRRDGEDAASTPKDDGSERIAKRLARAGISSRRDAETLIAAGRVSVNGKVLNSPAVNVFASDRIELDGKEIPAIERTRLFLFHKPAGVVTTNRDPEGRQTVFDVLPEGLPRLMTVGRLDINTEGLLLLTNDGGLARVLELPATGWLRRYRVRVHGKVEAAALESLKEGIAVDGTFYGAIEATLDREQGTNAWLTVGFREGKNREVKNVLGAIGLDVNRLIRISYGPFQLGELAEGEIRELKGKMLRDQLGERLVAESGANFDAPILNEFSNKPVSVREQKREEERDARPINRKREREERRENALGRLDTRKPMRGGAGKKPFGRGDDRDERTAADARPRKANVWMAPGAKPLGEKKKAELAERNEGRRYAGKPRPFADRKPGGDRPSGGKPGGFGRPSGPRKPRRDD